MRAEIIFAKNLDGLSLLMKHAASLLDYFEWIIPALLNIVKELRRYLIQGVIYFNILLYIEVFE